MSSKNGITAKPNQPGGCDDRGCFVDQISYSATKDQLEALIYISEHCEQAIDHVCNTNPLSDVAFWVDRNGDEGDDPTNFSLPKSGFETKFFHHKTVEYWNGDKGLNETGCTCYETNSCEKQNGFDSDRKCNCDDKRPGMVDVGVLTSLDQEG